MLGDVANAGDAALPFLSAAAGLMLLIATTQLRLEEAMLRDRHNQWRLCFEPAVALRASVHSRGGCPHTLPAVARTAIQRQTRADMICLTSVVHSDPGWWLQSELMGAVDLLAEGDEGSVCWAATCCRIQLRPDCEQPSHVAVGSQPCCEVTVEEGRQSQTAVVSLLAGEATVLARHREPVD